ncbi:MAG: rhamnogalacturonan acetylesterase [Firmicutes bacterium]|nr:rhamnogalacturonan acetylesterase [Bacillota bacterium]
MEKYINEPLVIDTSVPNGNYEVTLSVKAHTDTVYSVYTQNRRFAVIDEKIKAGEEREHTLIVNVCDYKRRDAEFKVAGVKISIACDGDITVTSAVSPADAPTLYIIGDSTVTDQPAEYPYTPHKTYCGWGQVMPMLLNTVAVSNHAESGSTTGETRKIHFTAIADKLKAGDFLMMEFGHNDQKEDSLKAFGGYIENLRYFIDFAREKGAVPIVNSPINRIIFNSDDTILNLLGEYRDAAEAVSREKNTAFIDMWTATTEFFEPLGLYTAKRYFRYDGDSQDYTHTNDIGGVIAAKMCAGMIKSAGIKGLSEYVLADRLDIEKPKLEPNAPKEYNYQEFTRLKSIGMGEVPADLDEDISHI